jgi:hypothetical protein
VERFAELADRLRAYTRGDRKLLGIPKKDVKRLQALVGK